MSVFFIAMWVVWIMFYYMPHAKRLIAAAGAKQLSSLSNLNLWQFPSIFKAIFTLHPRITSFSIEITSA
jgi:hypothetical protein